MPDYQVPNDSKITAAQVREYIRTHPGLTQTQLRTQLNMSPKGMSNRLWYLKNSAGVNFEGGKYYYIDGPLIPIPSRYKHKTPRKEVEVQQEVQEDGEVDGFTPDNVTVALVRLIFPLSIPTEKLPQILEWRQLTERIMA